MPLDWWTGTSRWVRRAELSMRCCLRYCLRCCRHPLPAFSAVSGVHRSNADLQALEADLDGDESALIPDLLVKLLYALTYNRFIKSVWQLASTQRDKR